MLTARAILLAAAASMAAAQLKGWADIGCTFTPDGFTPDKVSYSLQTFHDNSPYVVKDNRDENDPFEFTISFCKDVPRDLIPDDSACTQTRSMINESACTPPAYSASPVYQYYRSSWPHDDATVETGNPILAAREAGLTLPEGAKALSGPMKNSVIAAARDHLRVFHASVASADRSPNSRSAEAAAADAELALLGGETAASCGSDRCWRAAGSSAVPANIAYKPLVPSKVAGFTHMASGMSISLTGGDQCWDDGSGVGTGTAGVFPRQTNIHLICTNQSGALRRDALVVEVAKCNYEMILHTVHACPVQCLPDAADGSVNLCSHRGVCGYDTSSKRARCFCNEGWSGDQCDIEGDLGAPTTDDYGGALAAAFFLSVMGGLVVGAAGFYYVVYVRKAGPPAPRPASAPASGGVGGIRAMFGGSSSYAPPTPEGGAIPGIDDDGTAGAYTGPDDDADNPML